MIDNKRNNFKLYIFDKDGNEVKTSIKELNIGEPNTKNEIKNDEKANEEIMNVIREERKKEIEQEESEKEIANNEGKYFQKILQMETITQYEHYSYYWKFIAKIIFL